MDDLRDVGWLLDGIEEAHVEIANRLRNYTYAASQIDQLEPSLPCQLAANSQLY